MKPTKPKSTKAVKTKQNKANKPAKTSKPATTKKPATAKKYSAPTSTNATHHAAQKSTPNAQISSAKMEKAYKLLSIKEGISHGRAKALIDQGLVSCNGKKLTLARTLLPLSATFSVQEIAPVQILYEKGDILAVNKPAFMESYALEVRFEGYELAHRLDKETSGVLLLGRRGSAFIKEAHAAFKQKKARKVYYALVSGMVADEMTIDAPLLTRKGQSAKTKVHKDGLSAITHIKPKSIVGKKTLLEVRIETGRTHQIRAHLAHIGCPILGDALYGKADARRLMLHAYSLEILGHAFSAPLPREFTL